VTVPDGVGVPVVRVATWNVHDLRDDADAVRHVLRSLRADVVCLQEVPRRLGGAWRLARLAHETGLVVAAGGRGSGGTAVLVARSWDVESSAVHRMPVSHWWDRTRGVALASLSRPDDVRLTAASVHLPLRSEQRLDHARRLLAVLPTGPVVVAGDLNEEAGPASRLLHGALTATAVGPSYPARAPRRAIDAVLVTSGLSVLAARVAGAELGLDDATVRSASDHLPVVVDLRPIA
jgi:endonuclease/exonuclease/phosphatase family metal-dependent hydrolase